MYFFCLQIVGALNSFCWLEYGLLVNDSAVALVSLIGGVAMSIYTICFYCFSIRRAAVRKQIGCALMSYFILWTYLSYANINLEFTKHFCGIVCSGMTIVFFGSPLVNLVHVIRTKSTSTLPFLMILANFFVTGQWWFYGIIIEDNFLKIPYCLGWYRHFPAKACHDCYLEKCHLCWRNLNSNENSKYEKKIYYTDSYL